MRWMRTTYSSLQHQARKARTWFCKEKQAILETHFMYVCLLSRFSHVWLFETPWIAAHEGPLSMGFSKQEYWSGLPCPPPGDPPSAGFKPVSLTAPALAGGVGGGRCIFTAKATWEAHFYVSVQFSSVAQSCLTLCDPMNRSTPGLPVHHQLPEFTQTHVHRVRDAIQPSHPLSSSSPAPNPSQHQSLFQ